jgi:hypothetical protein
MKEKLRFLGLDVHAETIAVAIAEPDGEVRSLGTIPNRTESIRKMIKKLGPAEKPIVVSIGLRGTLEESVEVIPAQHMGCPVGELVIGRPCQVELSADQDRSGRKGAVFLGSECFARLVVT